VDPDVGCDQEAIASHHGVNRSLPGATAGRQAEPVLEFQPGVPPATRWAAGMRPRAGQPVHCRRSSRNRRPPPAARPDQLRQTGDIYGSDTISIARQLELDHRHPICKCHLVSRETTHLPCHGR
jgi:hypothetical protein